MPTVLTTTAAQVLTTFAHNWPFLLVGAVVAAALKLYAGERAIANAFRRHRATSVLLATGVAVATPLCSCGTIAVVLGMMATSMPWAPVVAFMAASPLTSPEELILSAGIFGWPFALAFFASSIAVGLGAGWAAHLLERHGWLAGQARFAAKRPATLPVRDGRPPRRPTLRTLALESAVGGRRLVLMFTAFAFLGTLLNNLIPAPWVGALFGRGNRIGVPLAAVLGLPLYVNTEASLPMVRAFVENGAGPGAALAFLITGAGTSIGAVSGALTIARWRVVAVIVASLLAGALLAGFAYDAAAGGV
jgi:uncharacterized membrane protein YraQ (UPF0718 family)